MKDSVVKFIDENGETKYIVDYDIVSEDRYKSIQNSKQIISISNKNNNASDIDGYDYSRIFIILLLKIVIIYVIYLYRIKSKKQNPNNVTVPKYDQNVNSNIIPKEINISYFHSSKFYNNLVNFENSIINLFHFKDKQNLIKLLNELKIFESKWDLDADVNFNYHDNKIVFPRRLYSLEISKDIYNSLELEEQIIVSCFYTLHHNGYVRERHLRNLRGIDYDWVIPFKLHLLGDYVLEIVKELHYQIDDSNITAYQKFIDNNFKFYRLQSSRTISYWSLYYRYYPNYNVVCQAKCKEFCQIDGKLIQDAECNLKFEFTKKYARSFTKQQYPGFQIIDKLKIRNK